MADISFNIAFKELKIAQIAQGNQLFQLLSYVSSYTAISRKVVGKSARDNPERHCGWF